jgi:hypothetical protein
MEGAVAQQALLLDRGRLRVPLGDDDPPQVVPELPGDLLPGRVPVEVAEADPAVVLGRSQEDPPAVVGHLHVVEVRPALAVHGDRGAQVDVVGLEPLRTGVLPPLEVVGKPALQRLQEPPVVGQIDVVGDLLVEVHR